MRKSPLKSDPALAGVNREFALRPATDAQARFERPRTVSLGGLPCSVRPQSGRPAGAVSWPGRQYTKLLLPPQATTPSGGRNGFASEHTRAKAKCGRTKLKRIIASGTGA